MNASSPSVIIVAGPNGAGKSTLSTQIFSQWRGKIHLVNADVIARGLSMFHSEELALEAGRVILRHLRKLAEDQADFAFETTLATKSFAPWLLELKASGYKFGLAFLWLPSAEMAFERVKRRKDAGGHFVPEDTVRRRYTRGIRNLFNIYLPFADDWKIWNNTDPGKPSIIAEGQGETVAVMQKEIWDEMKQFGAT